MKWFFGILVLLAAALGGLFWWFLLAGADVSEADAHPFQIDAWRAELARDDIAMRPTEIRLIEVGSDVAPGFAAQAGLFGADWKTTYGGFQIVTPTGSVFVDGGIDFETSEMMTQSAEHAAFDVNEYEELLNAFEHAEHIVLTHEHIDHVMAIARHPHPAEIAPNLRLNAPQKDALRRFTKSGGLPPAIADVQPVFRQEPYRLAPGILVVRASGHTEGSQVVFVILQNGSEYLLIGDIVWAMSNISDLKTRPRLTQVLVFDPNENRNAIKSQVRALHDLTLSDPDLTILPAHDRDYLMTLISDGSLGLGVQ